MEGYMTTDTPALPRLVLRLRPLASLLQPIAPLVSRLVIGWAFFETGKGKLGNLDGVTEFFAGLHIPFPAANAAFIATVETVGGLCLILGLGTRVFAALLSCTMVVAILTAHRTELLSVLGVGQPFEEGIMGIAPVPFLIVLLWLVAHGPGRISADRILFRSLDSPR
jgi:putative oxidoreductase